jgi:hypothetical protein
VTGVARSTYTVIFIKDSSSSSGDEYAVKVFPNNDFKAVVKGFTLQLPIAILLPLSF